jgi:hypothetical protein
VFGSARARALGRFARRQCGHVFTVARRSALVLLCRVRPLLRERQARQCSRRRSSRPVARARSHGLSHSREDQLRRGEHVSPWYQPVEHLAAATLTRSQPALHTQARESTQATVRAPTTPCAAMITATGSTLRLSRYATRSRRTGHAGAGRRRPATRAFLPRGLLPTVRAGVVSRDAIGQIVPCQRGVTTGSDRSSAGRTTEPPWSIDRRRTSGKPRLPLSAPSSTGHSASRYLSL